MTSTIGHWAFVIGVVLALFTGLMPEAEWLPGTLLVLGLIVGFLNVAERESTPFLVAIAVLLLIGASGLQEVEVLKWTEPILQSLIAFVAGAGIVVALKQCLTVARPS